MTHPEPRPDAPSAPTEATSSAPWLYVCPRCCQQDTTTIFVGPTWQAPLRKQHRKGCRCTYKVLIGQVPVPAAQLQNSRAIARDQASVVTLLLQRSEAAAVLVRAAVRSLAAVAEPDDLFTTAVRQRLETAVHLLTGTDDAAAEPEGAVYADFTGAARDAREATTGRRLYCNNCGQVDAAHPVEITREGRRLVCVLRGTLVPPMQAAVHAALQGITADHLRALADVDQQQQRATFSVTEAGHAALAEQEQQITRPLGSVLAYSEYGAPICEHGRQQTVCGECFPTDRGHSER